MQSLNDISDRKRRIEEEIESLKKKLSCAYKKLPDLSGKFVCEKCGMVFDKQECGYRIWEFGRTHQESQPMGDYDIWQTVAEEARYCCPKCGKDFKEQYGLYWEINHTPRYGRWDDDKTFLFEGWSYDKPKSKDIFVKKGKQFVPKTMPHLSMRKVVDK